MEGRGGQPVAVILIDGQAYNLDRSTCAGCRRPVLLASKVEGRASAVYDGVWIDPEHGPKGNRHQCPQERPEGARTPAARPNGPTAPPRGR